MKNKRIAVREKLANKQLLTKRESRLYLDLSKRQFKHLVDTDPHFPKPKDINLFSRFQLDDWLRLQSPNPGIDINSIRFSPHKIEFPISSSQLN